MRRRKTRRTRLINIYNRARVQGGGYTIDHIDVSRLIIGRTILAGDFNARSPAWDPWVAGRQNAQKTELLIEKHGLIVNNNDHQATRHGKSSRSIIDLTLSTRRVGMLAKWEINEALATTSDHGVIIFSWAPLGVTTAEREGLTSPNWNIDRLCADEEAVKSAGEHWRELSDRRAPLHDQAATADLEAEARWMQDSLRAVLDKHAPGRPPSARSKRWWTDDIRKERRLFGRATRDYNHDRIDFAEYRRVRNDYYRHIRRAKRTAWEHFLEGVFPTDGEPEIASDPSRCWRALRYTKALVPSHTPAIKIASTDSRPDWVAATAEDKEEVFMAQAFPRQPRDDGDIQTLDTKVNIRACEIREALFA